MAGRGILEGRLVNSFQISDDAWKLESVSEVANDELVCGTFNEPSTHFSQLYSMDFTLDQLSSQNLTLLFKNAFYLAEDLTTKNEEGEEESVATVIHHNDWNHVLYSDDAESCLTFETRITGIDAGVEMMLRICNFFDRFPVHANTFKAQDGSNAVSFMYKHIVPEGTSISDRTIIGVFRTFAQMVESHYAHWNYVKENVA